MNTENFDKLLITLGTAKAIVEATALAKEMGLDKASVTRILWELEEKLEKAEELALASR